MLKRGLKRKLDEGDSVLYQQNLQHFQNATRKRESMRIKTTESYSNNREEGESAQLKKKIEIETSLCLGTAKFLNSIKCDSGSNRSGLEAAKTLKLGRHRVDMLKYELNKLKRGKGFSSSSYSGSFAGLSLSHIRIPLGWSAKKQPQGSYAAFCIARIGSQIYDTALIYPVTPGITADLSFEEDVVLFAKVTPYFECTIEVYSHFVPSSNNVTSGNYPVLPIATPTKIVRSISQAVGRSILKRAFNRGSVFSKSSSDLKFENLDQAGPKFELIATATLKLDDCSEDVKSHDLYSENPLLSSSSSSDESEESMACGLPIFGSVCCRLAARPYCCEDEVLSGSLHLMHQKKSSVTLSTVKKVWASLLNWKLRLWSDLSQKESARQPLQEVTVDRNSIVRKIGGRLQVLNGDILWEFCFEPSKDEVDKEDLDKWATALITHSKDHERWKHIANSKMNILSPDGSDSEIAPRPFKRTRSKLALLYNDIGL